MAYVSLTPVSVAVFTKLNVAALTALATGGVSDDPAQGTTYPFVWYEVSEQDRRGLGTGELAEVDLRVHVFSQYEGLKDAQGVAQKVVQLLKDQALTVAGYNHCGHVFYDRTITLQDHELNGIKVHEVVSMFRIFVEAA